MEEEGGSIAKAEVIEDMRNSEWELGILEGHTACLRLWLMPLREDIARGGDGHWRTLRWGVFERLRILERLLRRRLLADVPAVPREKKLEFIRTRPVGF